MTRRILAVGVERREGGIRRVSIGFDPETFMQVRRRAAAANVSFGEQVRLLVEWGLEA